jgi:hypothetical protein
MLSVIVLSVIVANVVAPSEKNSILVVGKKVFFYFLALLNFVPINNTAVLQTGVFVTVNHFQPNLIFEGQQVLGSIP